MPTAYVAKLAKKHGIGINAAEKYWAKAKRAAAKQYKKDDYAYITSIFKKMMHENLAIPTLKLLVDGMTFKGFLIAEADLNQREFSPTIRYLQRFPQFNELPFRARRELEKEVTELISDYDVLEPEEKESIDDYVFDLVIDKLQQVVGVGANVGDWKDEEEYQKRQQYFRDMEDAVDAVPPPAPSLDDDVTKPVKRRRVSSGPRHIAAMRQRDLPIDPVQRDVVGPYEIKDALRKTYYKPWGSLTAEQKMGRIALAKKHGFLYRVKNTIWFKQLDPTVQQKMIDLIKRGEVTSVEELKARI